MAQPADLAGAYLRGVQTSAQIGQEQQRLTQQQQEMAQRTQQEQARLQQEHAVQQQRIAVTQAYQQQQVALKKRQLDQVKAVNDQKTANAARQFSARQQWQQGFAAIDADTTKSDAEKDAAKTSFTMRLAPMMGIPGTEAASMLRDMRPAKPTVPASVEDQGDFLKVTQPNGSVVLHPKPRTAAGSDNVKVRLEDGGVPVTMSRKQAVATIPNLSEDLQSDPVNVAAMPAHEPMTPENAPAFVKAGLKAASRPAAPQAGDIYKGHKFKGGDPADKNNWEKVD